MGAVVVLMIFAGLMSAVCVKARAAGPALVSGAVAVLLLCGLFSGLAEHVSDGVSHVGTAGADVAATVNDR